MTIPQNPWANGIPRWNDTPERDARSLLGTPACVETEAGFLLPQLLFPMDLPRRDSGSQCGEGDWRG